jgi:hypothetical protein
MTKQELSESITIPLAEYEQMKKGAERWIFVNSENYYVVCRYNDSPYGASYEPVEVESIDKAMEI